MANRYVVREATPDDADRIADIKVRNWADTYAPLVPHEVLGPFLDRAAAACQMRELVGAADVLVLVGETGTAGVQGFALTYLSRQPEPWLESVHVLAAERGRGLGTALIRATAERLLAAGYRSVALGVILGNDAAAALYERLGAINAGVEAVHWAHGVSHTVYRWPDVEAMRRLASGPGPAAT